MKWSVCKDTRWQILESFQLVTLLHSRTGSVVYWPNCPPFSLCSLCSLWSAIFYFHLLLWHQSVKTEHNEGICVVSITLCLISLNIITPSFIHIVSMKEFHPFKGLMVFHPSVCWHSSISLYWFCCYETESDYVAQDDSQLIMTPLFCYSVLDYRYVPPNPGSISWLVCIILKSKWELYVDTHLVKK